MLKNPLLQIFLFGLVFTSTQYMNAKKFWIEARNRYAISKAFFYIERRDKENEDKLLPHFSQHLGSSLFYSTLKNKTISSNSSLPLDNILSKTKK